MFIMSYALSASLLIRITTPISLGKRQLCQSWSYAYLCLGVKYAKEFTGFCGVCQSVAHIISKNYYVISQSPTLLILSGYYESLEL